MNKRHDLIASRKERQWLQEDVVAKLKDIYGLEITVSYYGMIEQGVRTPRLELALAIANLFDKEPGDIFFSQYPNKTLGEDAATVESA